MADNPTKIQPAEQWQFWIDRGGTFTDIVARNANGCLLTRKLLSDNPEQYNDAAIQGIRDCLGLSATQAIPASRVESVRMGTTVATNALLEHRGEPVVLVTTRGFGDALQIACQQRPDLFALDIQLPQMLYSRVIEANERIRADGTIEQVLDSAALSEQLQQARRSGLRSVAIVFMHAWKFPQHEKRAAELAAKAGFSQISVSHQVSALIKFIGRGDTTVVDACLSPVLRAYVKQLAANLPQIPLLFMQSNGGLAHADFFQGKDAVLSGPAGGVIGMVKTAQAAGFDKLIGFDMGGTSTDVCHYDGDYERTLESMIAGLRIRAPMMRIHTVAAGGSSILHFDGQRLRVGPDSAGANPGPVCYRRGGPLTITDCNVMLGKLQPTLFPAVFGETASQMLDAEQVKKQFVQLARHRALSERSVEQIAEGFLTIAVENMANAIRKISLQRGYDISAYTLCCFGGASGQHACMVAEALGMSRIFLHPFAGVLSAYGMGMADLRKILTYSIEQKLDQAILAILPARQQQMIAQTTQILRQQIPSECRIEAVSRLYCRYEGADTSLLLPWCENIERIREQFDLLHQQRFGFISAEKELILTSIEVEVIADANPPMPIFTPQRKPEKNRLVESGAEPASFHCVFIHGSRQKIPFFQREVLLSGQMITGPAVIIEQTGTTVIEPEWFATVDNSLNLILEHQGKRSRKQSRESPSAEHNPLASEMEMSAIERVDPVKLEIFNNLFMSIAEQMGYVLEQTAVSVNIKERLDFSCAIFDAQGNLVANAPHMPVHLGSMSETVKAVIRENTGADGNGIEAGDAFVLNNPYNGGTHLPDITLVRPVFDCSAQRIIFYVASRGHHGDIGGTTPGSIPPRSRSIDEEGVLINHFKLLHRGVFREQAMRELFAGGNYPARNIDGNIADLKAQLAACSRGEKELNRIIQQMGLDTVRAYMRYVQDNAEESVRRVIATLKDGQFSYCMDDASKIKVRIRVDKKHRCATIDFTGTSVQHPENFNAPAAITRAAVLYVFRCLVEDAIPLNEGCLKPLTIIIPQASMLNPQYPAAVVAGNVETSQAIVDTLFGALKIMGAAQGTMNNVTWGNENYQYYETLCGGAGATAKHDGASGVHTHMTNSRLTDPEILESRYPVVLDEFCIRHQSGGKGRHKGGDGVIRQTRFLESMTVSIVSGHRQVAPYGMKGGEPGRCGENIIIRATGRVETCQSVDSAEVQAGDCLRISTPGGGGYGRR